MPNHILLPSALLEQVTLLPEHEAWLDSWLHALEANIERGDIAASLCLQGAISELALYGRTKTDWAGVMDEYLIFDAQPIAYSETFSKRLYKFVPWIQTEVHAIHARWWIEKVSERAPSLDYKALIESLIQPSGWIYNPSVSLTGLRTRMKSEYLMSFAMGLEILAAFNALENGRGVFEAVLSSEPVTGYLGAEHFRLTALEFLSAPNLAPVNLDGILMACEVGQGYCDFDVASKIDDYMGTAKRVGRDIPVHSGLSSLHALTLASVCDKEVAQHVHERVRNFGEHLKKNPLDIQPFKMRDLDVPFGTGLSPLEIVAASTIASR